MYLPRNLIAHLYQNLIKRTHAAAPPVLLLVALEPDALCACRILTALLKRDYIPHKIQPIAGYGDLSRVAEELVRPMRTTDGGSGGVVICLGVGGMVDMEEILGLDVDENGEGGTGDVEVWLLDARRPWNLTNVFAAPISHDPATGEFVRRQAGVDKGKILQSYQSSRGGIIVFDDGDIEDELQAEREAYAGLEEMPEVGEEDDMSDDSDDQEEQPPSGQAPRKRKSWGEEDDSDHDMTDDERPAQRRRSNSGGSIPSSPEPRRQRGLLAAQLGGSSDFSRSDSRSRSVSPAIAPPKEQSLKSLRRQLIKKRNKYAHTLDKYYELGTSYSDPVSSLVYNLASELGREDNDLLWNAIVGVSSLELYGRTGSGVGLNPLSAQGGSAGWNGNRGENIRSVLRDEVRRLNPVTDATSVSREATMGEVWGVIPTTARSATDKSIRLSPEPRFLLLRHWSLYESMLHSPYLSAKLHIWSDAGQKRLAKLLAKMGVSLTECKQRFTHMDMELKRGLRERLIKFAPQYGLDGLVPPKSSTGDPKDGWGFVRCWGWKACLSAIDAGVILGAILEVGDAKSLNQSSFDSSNFVGNSENNEIATTTQEQQDLAQEHITSRFWTAYDALGNIDMLVNHISTAQHLYRAILRTGTALIEKKQIRHLRAFRMAVVKEGPDVQLFTHPGALTKLALWIAEAIVELNGTKGKNKGSELVMAGLDDSRGLYVVVGLGGGGATESAKSRLQKREAKIKAKEARQAQREEARKQRRKARIARNIAAGLDEDEVADDSESEAEASDSSDNDSSDDDEEEDEQRGAGRNRFGNAFQEVVRETGARVRMDSFEACVIEIKKEDLSGFLEKLSQKAVVG
ncbi:DNA replication initiation factor Cdc45 [Pyrenophora teres f. maculata]|nr:DNA replication initiation factor Cdc45 [Pyrenophora teres f. maculata]